jgi:mannose-6-phosphate isomerase-like protein (cupin superfamily)
MSRTCTANIEQLTRANTNYRRVLCTTPTMQLVVMCLEPLAEIPTETHPHTTQFIRAESGTGVVTMNQIPVRLEPDHMIIIPPNTTHRVQNTSPTTRLHIYTIYSPPEHPEDCVQQKATDVCVRANNQANQGARVSSKPKRYRLIRK